MKALLAAVVVILITACTDGGQTAELENYLNRLARPLNIDVPPIEIRKSPPPPRSAGLQIALPGSKMDGLDFLRLRGCALQQTVARRNSSLGRVAPPSQRLLLELAFLRDAPACIEVLRSANKDSLADLIQETAALKESQLPALIFNATLGNREYRDFWRATAPAEDYPSHTSSLAITALEQVTADANRWVSGDFRADEIGFELALSEIARGDGGELITALSRQAGYLKAGNELITARIARGPMCTDSSSDPAAPIVRTVVGKYFIQEVQARAAALNQRHYALQKPIAELELLLSSALPETYGRWQHSRNLALEEGANATKGHVGTLQSLLGNCYTEFANKTE